VHEFAHGLTLKHFGGRVEEMGFQFLYFIPALYCNVSDAWLLKRRERILVTFAGGYVQFVIWAWATIAWRLLAPETFGSRVCLITIGFAAVQAAFNFNPLLKLDGYYILSDYLEIPNLRAKAFAHLRRRASEAFSGSWRYRSGANGNRHERVFAVYGTAAFAFTAGILWIMLDRIGGWLIGEFQVWGIVFVSAFFLMAIPAASRDAMVDHRRMIAGSHGSAGRRTC
jgi:putative peptide zinc metalloprotease protein